MTFAKKGHAGVAGFAETEINQHFGKTLPTHFNVTTPASHTCITYIHFYVITHSSHIYMHFHVITYITQHTIYIHVHIYNKGGVWHLEDHRDRRESVVCVELLYIYI